MLPRLLLLLFLTLAPLAHAASPDPAALAAEGAAALERGELDLAVERLEYALLLDPTLLGARLDLALAYARLGQTELARALAEPLLARTDLPPGLAALLAPAPRGWLQTLLVHRSNRSLTPQDRTLWLTLPQGRTPFTLSERPDAGFLTQNQLGLLLRPDLLLTLDADLGGGRASERERLTLAYQPTLRDLLTLAHERWQGEPLTSELRYERRLTPTWSAEAGLRHWHGGLDTLDGLPLTLSARLPLPARLYGRLDLLADAPLHADRPGGWRLGLGGELRAQAQAHGWRLDAGLQYTEWRDRDGYSPLLENDARRRLRQATLRLDLAPQHSPFFLRLQWDRQDSNLSLFRLHDTTLGAGLLLLW
jgi:hypothetical protein